jgi:peptide/nickel transport system substrate-binding protein
VSSRVARPNSSRLAWCLLLFAAGCGGSAPASRPVASGPVRGGTLTASIRSEPNNFNRYGPNSNTTPDDVVARLTHAPLVRLNRLTGEPEPWLAEKWTTSADGRTLTITLRDGVTFSDGAPFTSEDVLFSFRAVYDPDLHSNLASGLEVQGKPLQLAAPDARTVVVTLPSSFAPGIALLDNLPIYPKHQLQAALDAHTFDKAWGITSAPGSMAGLGPFVLAEYVQGQRLTFTRNPHYWRKDASGASLPYLDRLVLDVVAGQDAEILRMEAGSIDLMSQADLRPEDIAPLRRLRDQGAIQLVDVGTSVDPNTLWFNLAPAPAALKAKPYLQRKEFRQAISSAVDRDAIVKTLFLGAAVPAYGPVTPGNTMWYSDAAPKYPRDLARAKALLAGLGLTDTNGDGMLEDRSGQPVRFSIITQAQNVRARVSAMIQEQLRQAGIAVDVVALDPQSLFSRFGAGNYESMYYGFAASALDPALNHDFWLSSGSSHVREPDQIVPATAWE